MAYKNTMKIYWIVLIGLLLPAAAMSQTKPQAAITKHTISGFIKDSLNGETLIGATITVSGKTKGISSNQYGFYSITLEEGNYLLVCSFIGYQPKVIAVKLDGNKQIDQPF